MNPSFQLTMEYSKDSISFLDFLIKRNNDKTWMDIYYKSTDTHMCLSFSSNHANCCKKNITVHWLAVSAQLLKTLKQK